MKQRVADYVADFLLSHGICHCFTVTGGGAMYLNDALGHKEGLDCVYQHHEQACAIAAEGYTRLTGRLAAVCVTSGPGGTNALTGVLGGWLDSIPMLILSGQVKRAHLAKNCPVSGLRQLGDQEFDIVGSALGMTKYAVTVLDPKDIAYHLEKAYRLATFGRGGPVWLDLPLDVQGATVETDALRHYTPEAELLPQAPPFHRETARDILQKIKAAKAPLLLVGTGVRLGGAVSQLRALINKLQIPVVTAWNAGDTVAFENPHFAGMPGTVGTRAGNFAVQNCDLLLSLGCRLNIRTVGHNRGEFAKNAYRIIVDIDEKELKKPTIMPDLPICADVREVIDRLLQEDYVPSAAHAAWVNFCRALVTRYPAAPVSDRESADAPLNPYTFLDCLFDHLLPTDHIICGNGSACVMTFQAAKVKEGQRMFTNSGCAAMGYGLPAAIGAAFGDPRCRTVCIDGDGSIMMNLQELATVAYHRLNIKIVLLNNGGYHSIRQTQRNLFSAPFVGINAESGLGFPDFEIVARAFGIGYARVRSACDLQKQLDTVLKAEGPVLFEVIVDPTKDFAPKSSTKKLPDGRLVSPALEDMAPFLSGEELDAARYLK
ncbi:MAG: thiamine pyrophosphate-binding protein [Clostridia bacterium]|nr:thiamine pyrophosphate-binding protein [Clostridia bacterium]